MALMRGKNSLAFYSVLVAAISVIITLAAIREISTIAIIVSLAVAVTVIGFAIQWMRNGLSYYPWFVIKEMPLLLAGVGLLGASLAFLSRVANEQEPGGVMKCVPPATPTPDSGLCSVALAAPSLGPVSGGTAIAFLVAGTVVGGGLTIWGLRRLFPLSRQRELHREAVEIELVSLGETTEYSVVSGRRFDACERPNFGFRVRFRVHRWTEPFQLVFLALERIDVRGRTTGYTWTSTRLPSCGLLALTAEDRSQAVLNADGRLRGCNAHDQADLYLHIDGEPGLFQPGTRFQAVAYGKDGGFASAQAEIPQCLN